MEIAPKLRVPPALAARQQNYDRYLLLLGHHFSVIQSFCGNQSKREDGLQSTPQAACRMRPAIRCSAPKLEVRSRFKPLSRDG